jgi:ABC-type polar amino acid transport system ATPase subunit
MEETPTEPMIRVRNLVKHRGPVPVINRVSLEVRPGEVAAVIGPSGGGKSTLLRCINALEPFEEGEVAVNGLRIGPGDGRGTSGLTRQRLRRQVGMVFQQFHLFPHMTALENVLSGPLYSLGRSRDEAYSEAQKLLERVGLGDKLERRPNELSGGEQQRVAIARALAVYPLAILFDEPTSALDPRMATEVLAVIAELARTGQTMIVVTHAMGFARRVAQTVHVMHQGQLIESGTPTDVLERPKHDVTRNFVAEAGS